MERGSREREREKDVILCLIENSVLTFFVRDEHHRSLLHYSSYGNMANVASILLEHEVSPPASAM